MKKFRNIFKCCSKGGETSYDIANGFVESNDSIDNLSMISVTYGLENFSKNALLLFCQVTSEMGSRNRDLAMKQVALLKETFQKYRFEVETHVDLTSSEVEEKCDKFFGRDFTEYGAVAVVILASHGESGTLAARDAPFDENVIVKHLTTDVPVSLKDKPKIYITEANRMNTSHDDKSDSLRHSLAINDCFEDVLGLHIPLVIETGARSPIQIFCDRMNNSEDHGNLIGIVIGTIQEIEETFPALREKLELACTFRKRFTLPMFVLLA